MLINYQLLCRSWAEVVYTTYVRLVGVSRLDSGNRVRLEAVVFLTPLESAPSFLGGYIA